MPKFQKSLLRGLVLILLVSGGPQEVRYVYGQSGQKNTGRQERQPTRKRPVRKVPSKTTTREQSRPAGRDPAARPPASSPRPASEDRAQPGRVSRTRARPPADRSQPQRPPTRRARPRPRPVEPVPEIPPIDAGRLSHEFSTLSEELHSSRLRLKQAQGNLQPLEKRTLVRVGPGSGGDIRELEQQVSREPDNPELHLNLALQYEARQDWDKARDLYLRLVTRNPLNPDVHYHLGRFYVSRHDLEKARQSFEEALDLDPDHSATLDALAAYSGSTARREMSGKVLERASQTASGGAGTQMALIRKEILEGDPDRALTMIDNGLKEYPRQAGFYFLRGLAYEKKGDRDRAKSGYQQAIRHDPKQTDAHLALADLYFSQGKYVYAALSYGDAIFLDPALADARFRQGWCYYLAAEWKRAAAAWEDLLHHAPRHPKTLNLLPQVYYIQAMEYNRLGESARGRAAFTRATSVNANTYDWLPEAQLTLGRYYRDKGLYQESLKAYQEAVELRPLAPDAYNGMGITYWKMNQREKARAAWKRSLELDAGNNAARGWLILSRQS